MSAFSHLINPCILLITISYVRLRFILPMCNACLFEEELSIHPYEIISPKNKSNP